MLSTIISILINLGMVFFILLNTKKEGPGKYLAGILVVFTIYSILEFMLDYQIASNSALLIRKIIYSFAIITTPLFMLYCYGLVEKKVEKKLLLVVLVAGLILLLMTFFTSLMVKGVKGYEYNYDMVRGDLSFILFIYMGIAGIIIPLRIFIPEYKNPTNIENKKKISLLMLAFIFILFLNIGRVFIAPMFNLDAYFHISIMESLMALLMGLPIFFYDV